MDEYVKRGAIKQMELITIIAIAAIYVLMAIADGMKDKPKNREET